MNDMSSMPVMPKKRSRQAATVITDTFASAARDYAFKGTMRPDEAYKVEHRYRNARTRLINYLMDTHIHQ